MTAQRIGLIVNLVYVCIRDAAVWAIVMRILEAPPWSFGVLWTLTGVLFLLLLKGCTENEARKRSSADD